MSVQIAGISFEHHDYDARGDVLYVSVAGSRESSPAHADASPEGHGVEYDESGRVIAMTLANARLHRRGPDSEVGGVEDLAQCGGDHASRGGSRRPRFPSKWTVPRCRDASRTKRSL